MIIAIVSTGGCATTGDNGVWPRLVASGQSSVKQKSVWIPLAAAAVFASTSLDREVSDWAVEHQPVFSSVDNAVDWSGRMTKAVVATALTASFMRREEHNQPLVADTLSLGGAYGFTTGVKNVANRTRPNNNNDLSFPSTHATMAFAGAQIAARNLSVLETRYADAIRVGLYTFASASAWARIEAAKHFPSDVLAGAAIGNFFAGTANAFLGAGEKITVSYVPTHDGGEFRIQWLFR